MFQILKCRSTDMFKFLHNYFFPHTRNNHRSKILHNTSLFIIILVLLASSVVSLVVNRANPSILGVTYSMTDQELLILVNQERIANGKEPLKLNAVLSSAAKQKAEHMFANNYWAHFAPDSTSPWHFITTNGYNYIYAGENLAKGFSNAQEVVKAWMESPAHRDNILSSQYRDIGFAIVPGHLQGEDTVLIVEMFGQEKNPFLATADVGAINQEVVGEEDIALDESDANEVVEVPFLGTHSENDGSEAFRQVSLYQSQPFFDALTSGKTIAFIFASILLIALILDFLIISRRKIPRIVGNNIDHIVVLSVFIVFIVIYNIGTIL